MKGRFLKLKNTYRVIKRFFDFLVSLILLVILSPLYLIIAIAIYIDDKRPIIFAQQRTGQGNKPFIIYKFRTMEVNDDDKADTGGHE